MRSNSIQFISQCNELIKIKNGRLGMLVTHRELVTWIRLCLLKMLHTRGKVCMFVCLGQNKEARHGNYMAKNGMFLLSKVTNNGQIMCIIGQKIPKPH